MMRWLMETSMRLRFLVLVLSVILLSVGIYQLRTMPVDVYPEFDPPLVEVQTEALGLSAAEVESLITVPMEADLLNGVAWLDQLYSESVSGLSSILLVFEPGTDPIRARQMVQERLTQAHALPNVSTPPVMLQPLSTTSRVMLVKLTSEDLSPIETSVLARWNIKPRLMGVPGVANVAIWGQRERQLQVLVDQEKLHTQGVTLDQIIRTTGEALWVSPLTYLRSSKPGTGGWIDTANQRLGIRHLLPISSAEDLSEVIVLESDGKRLGEVADVVEDHQPLIGDAVLEEGTGLLLVIEKFPSANTLDVTRGVEDAFEALGPGLSGMEIDTTVYRPANYIELAINNLGRTLLIGGLLVLLVLVLMFLSWRATLTAIVAIPVSLVAAVMVLYLRGATFNIMILAGLAIALVIIIDDAVIDADNIMRRLRENGQEGTTSSPMAVIANALLEMRGAIAYATLILLLASLPLFFVEGLTGVFVRPLVVSYVLAVGAAFIVALIVTPALSLTVAPAANRSGDSTPPIVRALQRVYRAMVAPTTRVPYVMFILAAIIILAGLAALPFLDRSLMPSLKQPDLLISWEGAPGTSHPEMSRITSRISEDLRAIPGVHHVGSHVGRAILGDQVVGINSGEVWVSLEPDAHYDSTVASIEDVASSYPGFQRAVLSYQPERLDDALLGTDRDMVVRVFGTDLKMLRSKSGEIAQLMSGIDGIEDVKVDIQAEQPEVVIEVDLDAVERYGLKPGDVRRQATTLMSGLMVGNLFEEQKVFDVVVWGEPQTRESMTSLQNLLIDTPNGDQVRLEEVADVSIDSTPISIRRDAVSRFVDVGVTVNGRRTDAVAADVRTQLQSVDFPLESHAEIVTRMPGIQQAIQMRTWGLLLAIVIGILLLLQAAFENWRLATVVWLTLPVTLAGGILACLIFDGVLSLGSLFGLMAAMGIAVRNSVVLFNHCIYLEQVEGEEFGRDIVLRGSIDRLGPILTTSLATVGVFLPVLYFGTIPGQELLYPMAIVILGGIVASAFLNLFVLPAAYLRFGYTPEQASSIVPEPVPAS